MHRFFDGVDRGLRALAVTLTLVMLVILTLQIFARYVLGQALLERGSSLTWFCLDYCDFDSACYSPWIACAHVIVAGCSAS